MLKNSKKRSKHLPQMEDSLSEICQDILNFNLDIEEDLDSSPPIIEDSDLNNAMLDILDL